MSRETDEISDGWHTFKELYEYRMLYNAAMFNELVLAERLGQYPSLRIHKSWLHHDGQPPFGKPLKSMFIVVAELPTGQISNHYKAEHWDLFKIPEWERAADYDGHTPSIVAQRLRDFLKENY